MSFLFLIGEVGCKPTTFLIEIFFFKKLMACSQAESDAELSLAYLYGLGIIFAPNLYRFHSI